jgi:outer membrane lipase/esterase
MKSSLLTTSAALFGLCSSVFASFPHDIAVLGDSLSDSGNSRPVVGFAALPPITLPYFRFCPITDGVTWPVLLSEQLNTNQRLTPYVRGGTNYAYVAAQTVDIPALLPPVNPSVTDQLSLIPSQLNRKTPVFVFAGANDIYAYDPVLYPFPGFYAAVNLGAILNSLHNQGFKYLIILNMPDIGATPSVLNTPSSAIYTAQSGALNVELQAQLSTLTFPVLEIDLFSFFKSLLQNYTQYGFASVTTAPSAIPYPVPGGESTAGYAFWYDGTHFSEATHQLISDYVYSVLSGAECYATMAETPFAILREQTSGIKQQLFPDQARRIPKKWYFFANGTYTPLAVPALSDSCTDNKLHGGNLSFGVMNQISDSWNAGVAGQASWNQYHCHTQTTKCAYDLNAYTLSFFGGWALPAPVEESKKIKNKKSEPPESHQGGYANAIVSVAWLGFDDIKRQFSVGPVSQQTDSDTSGMDYYGSVYGAYYLPSTSPHLNTGPLLSAEYQFTTVEGYTEYDLLYGALVFKNQNNSSFSTGLGWEVRFEYPGFVGDLFCSANRQWLGQTRKIHFREKSLPANNGIWPAEMPQTTFISGGINFAIFCKQSVVVSVGYTFNCGISDIPMREQFLNVGISL